MSYRDNAKTTGDRFSDVETRLRALERAGRVIKKIDDVESAYDAYVLENPEASVDDWIESIAGSATGGGGGNTILSGLGAPS